MHERYCYQSSCGSAAAAAATLVPKHDGSVGKGILACGLHGRPRRTELAGLIVTAIAKTPSTQYWEGDRDLDEFMRFKYDWFYFLRSSIKIVVSITQRDHVVKLLLSMHLVLSSFSAAMHYRAVTIRSNLSFLSSFFR